MSMSTYGANGCVDFTVVFLEFISFSLNEQSVDDFRYQEIQVSAERFSFGRWEFLLQQTA